MDHAGLKNKQICIAVLKVILSEILFKNEGLFFKKNERKLTIFQSDIYFIHMSDTILWFDSQISGFTEDGNMHEKQKYSHIQWSLGGSIVYYNCIYACCCVW